MLPHPSTHRCWRLRPTAYLADAYLAHAYLVDAPITGKKMIMIIIIKIMIIIIIIIIMMTSTIKKDLGESNMSDLVSLGRPDAAQVRAWSRERAELSRGTASVGARKRSRGLQTLSSTVLE